MKKIIYLVLIIVLTSSQLIAQQTYSLQHIHYNIDDAATVNRRHANPRQALLGLAKATKPDSKGIFGIEGAGTLSTEELKKSNGAGKISILINPYPVLYGNGRTLQSLTHISLNKNATNNDTLLPSTILFPELGNVSFSATTELLLKIQEKSEETQYFGTAFFDFALKDVKGNINDSIFRFNTLSYSVGLRFLIQYYYLNSSDEIRNANLAVSLYANFLNIPDEDIYDYTRLMRDPYVRDNLSGIGVKVQAQYSNFIFFADLRHTAYDGKSYRNRDIDGFSSNIGIAVAGDLFRF
jgi:hypothetical protein